LHDDHARAKRHTRAYQIRARCSVAYSDRYAHCHTDCDRNADSHAHAHANTHEEANEHTHRRAVEYAVPGDFNCCAARFYSRREVRLVVSDRPCAESRAASAR
jgi:hypothetical protein